MRYCVTMNSDITLLTAGSAKTFKPQVLRANQIAVCLDFLDCSTARDGRACLELGLRARLESFCLTWDENSSLLHLMLAPSIERPHMVPKQNYANTYGKGQDMHAD